MFGVLFLIGLLAVLAVARNTGEIAKIAAMPLRGLMACGSAATEPEVGNLPTRTGR
jgi:hypothetical protein